MFSIYRQKRAFHILRVDEMKKLLLIEDLLSGLKIEIPYGDRELKSANFINQYELHLAYKDGSEKSINLLMQGY